LWRGWDKRWQAPFVGGRNRSALVPWRLGLLEGDSIAPYRREERVVVRGVSLLPVGRLTWRIAAAPRDMSNSGAQQTKVAEERRKPAGGVKMESAKDGTSTGGLRPLRGRLTWFNERPRAVFVSNFADVPPPRLTVAGTLTNPILLCCLLVVSTCLLVAWPCDYYRPYGSGGWYNVSKAFSDLSGGLGDPLIRSDAPHSRSGAIPHTQTQTHADTYTHTYTHTHTHTNTDTYIHTHTHT